MTEHQAREVLLAHGIPEQILSAWSDRQSPVRHLAWSKPDFAKAEGLERRVPGLKELCPMFEQNGEAVVAYLPQSGQFIRYYYEDAEEGEEAIEILGKGYQQFACGILLEFEEAGMSDAFDELASALRFDRSAELRVLLDAEPYDDTAVDSFHSRLASSV
jgi:hypothetical protein